ncbi:MAG: hypothetical protein CMC41_07785 [Flavobacteriaceae bacterium]|nr:hypothetical protein [Flavobacteriaceae bacterium]|tara:strand:- start:322 stop:612 length:291 start_codon:yes stop_codon:yes gene_type:complete
MPRYILENGVRRQMTDAEETARDAEETAWANGALDRAMDTLRTNRDRIIAETDYLALSDVTMSDAWKTYRQSLRDITSGVDTVEKAENVTWPTKPS